VLLHFISPFYAFVENFTSYVTLYLYACICYGLRLLDLNKDATYLLCPRGVSGHMGEI